MNEEVVKYIKEQLANGHTISEITNALTQQGYTQEQSDNYFKLALSSQTITPPLPPPPTSNLVPETTEQPQTSQTPPKHFDITKAFVVIGAILIILATIIVIYSQWFNVGSAVKIMFMVIPMAILYGLGGYLNNRELYKETANVMIGLASFILPFAIGTIICQTKIVDEVNAMVVFLSAISSLPFYLILEYMFKKNFIGVYTIISIFVAYFAIITQYHADLSLSLWLAFVLSVLIVLTGFMLIKFKQGRSTFYLVLGTVASLGFLPIATLYSLNNDNSLSMEANSFIISGFGLLYLVVASQYYFLYKKLNQHVLYVLKRLIEEVAPFIFLIPIFFLGFDKVGFAVLALFLSIVFVLISTKVVTHTLIFLGSLGIIVSIFIISAKLFTDSLYWPVMLFVAGFVAIGIGLVIRKIFKDRKDQGSLPVVAGLGIDPNESEDTKQGVKKSPVRVIVIVVIILFFDPSLLTGLFWLFSSIGSRNYSDPGRVEIPNSQTENYQDQSSIQTIPETQSTPMPTLGETSVPKTEVAMLYASGEVTSFNFDTNNKADPRTNPRDWNYNRVVIHTNPVNDTDFFQGYISDQTLVQLNGTTIDNSRLNDIDILSSYTRADITYFLYDTSSEQPVFIITKVNFKP